MKIKKPELLAPAGNPEKLKFAILYGADAVYLGGRKFNLRTSAENFTLPQMKKGIDFAKKHGVKVYVVVNIFPRCRDFKEIGSYLRSLQSIGVDAIVVSDYGLFEMIKDKFSQFEVHISTQANICNLQAVKFWSKLGAKRVTLARELSIQELKKIAKSADIETEVFVHGAMCISYSGRCLLSKYLTGRDANQGDCAHSCRWKYYLMEADPPAARLPARQGEAERSGKYHPVYEDKRGFYIFNSKDLCLIEYLPELIKAGIGSFKIEGRMKSIHYLATVVSVYRQAIDAYCSDPKGYKFDREWKKELEKVSHRGYTTGFVVPDQQTESVESAGYRRSHDFVGVVEGYDRKNSWVRIAVRNQIKSGDDLEILKVKGGLEEIRIRRICQAESGEKIKTAHPNFVVNIPKEKEIPRYSILRRRASQSEL